jgi:hypothetical protein
MYWGTLTKQIEKWMAANKAMVFYLNHEQHLSIKITGM